MSGDEAGARKPQIGDVWRSRSHNDNVAVLTEATRSMHASRMAHPGPSGPTDWYLIGHVFPAELVDHPGIEVLRGVLDRNAARWAEWDRQPSPAKAGGFISRRDAAALADLLSLLAPSPGGPTP